MLVTCPPNFSGFSILEVEGPCPFRIEVTNSFVHLLSPNVPGGEAAVSGNRNGCCKKGKCDLSDAEYGSFRKATRDSSGRLELRRQRAPISTIPSLSVRVDTIAVRVTKTAEVLFITLHMMLHPSQILHIQLDCLLVLSHLFALGAIGS